MRDIKKKILPILLFVTLLLPMTSCMDNDDSTWEQYREWREYNQSWLLEELTRTNADGTSYYTQCIMPTDPQAVIYMHRIGESNSEALQPLFTSTTKVNYTLKLANDSVLDKATDFVSQLSSTSLITGWSLAVMQLHVGDTAQFILPYNVGYGSIGSTNILPYTNLQFNIRLVDIEGFEVRP